MVYIKYFITLIIAVMVMIVVSLSLILSIHQPPAEVRWIQHIYDQKEAIVAKHPGKKIFIMGGSSAHYGVSAEMIAKQTDIPTINFGSHALLDSRYHGYKILQHAKAGDIVLIASEYINFKPSKVLSEVLVAQTLFHDRAFISQNSPAEVFHIILGFDYVNAAYHALRFILGIHPDYYHKNKLGAWGDETINTLDSVTSVMQDNIKKWGPQADPIQDLSAFSVPYIKEFVKKCRKQGVTPILVWSNIADHPDYHTAAYKTTFSIMAQYFETIGLPVLISPYDAMLEHGHMYDTVYHPNEKGRTIRTQKIIDKLKVFFASRS